jgi:hypothetical protein
MREKLVINGELLNTTTQTDYCMKKLIKYLICLLMVMLACTVLTSCSDDDEPGKIELAKGESSKVSVAANTSSGSIKFTAAAPWSAYTSAQSRSSDGVDWIHLNTTSGSAGEVSLTFTLDRNTTGSNRTAYIIIVCEDETLTITITQTTETDSDEDEGDDNDPVTNIGMVSIEVTSYNQDGVADGSTINYEITLTNGIPARIFAIWKKTNEETTLNMEFTADRSVRDAVTSIRAISQKDWEGYGRKGSESSERVVAIKNGRAVSGWYKWDSDRLPTNWEATYNNNGYLASTKNDDGDGAGIWSTHTMTWTNDCLSQIVCTTEKYDPITIEYADPSLKNLHSEFDINWILCDDDSLLYSSDGCYNVAAGDATTIFAVCGFMGNPSKYLITSINQPTSYNSYRRMDYKENTLYRTVVTVTEFVHNVPTGYKEWTIYYFNII